MLFAKRTAAVANECVACGSCVKVCPMKAITIYKGLRAVVNNGACIGCGKCAKACPADVIGFLEVNVNEKAVV